MRAKVGRGGFVLALMSFAGLVRAGDLPRAIDHEVLPSGQHRYTIHGLSGRVEVLRDVSAKFYANKIPGCVNLTADTANRTMTIETQSELTSLPSVIDRFAQGGIVPYWEELQIRDRKSPAFDADAYGLRFQTNMHWGSGWSSPRVLWASNETSSLKIRLCSQSIQGDGTTSFTDCWLRLDCGYRFDASGERHRIPWDRVGEIGPADSGWARQSIRCSTGMRYTIALNKTTALCSWHSRYALRIFDAKGQFVWEDQTNVYGTPVVFASDITGDGFDEIVVYEEDHGTMHLLVFGPSRRWVEPAVGLSNGQERTLGPRMQIEQSSVRTPVTLARGSSRPPAILPPSTPSRSDGRSAKPFWPFALGGCLLAAVIVVLERRRKGG